MKFDRNELIDLGYQYSNELMDLPHNLLDIEEYALECISMRIKEDLNILKTIRENHMFDMDAFWRK